MKSFLTYAVSTAAFNTSHFTSTIFGENVICYLFDKESKFFVFIVLIGVTPSDGSLTPKFTIVENYSGIIYE